MPKPKRPIVAAFVSDPHIGSQLGICPPRGVTFKSGGRYLPGAIQRWTWHDIWRPYWRWIGRLRDEAEASLRVVINGDAMDSHEKGQIISRNPEDLLYLGVKAFDPVKELEPDSVIFVEGTPSHTGGEEAELEGALAHRLADHGFPILMNGVLWTWPEIDVEWNGTTVHIAHHGKIGGREATLQSNAANHTADIANFYRARGREPQQLWIMAHRHQLADSGQSLVNSVRYVVQPAMQAKTPYGHKVAAHRPAELSDLGGLAGTFYPDGTYLLRKFVVYPAEEAPAERI